MKGWSKVCFDELGKVFDEAHRGLDPFVADALRLEVHLGRAAALRTFGDDLAHLGRWAKRTPEVGLVLPSERQRGRDFAQWSLGVDSMDRHLDKTFDLVREAASARCGPTKAGALVDAAEVEFESVRREVRRRLRVGPALLRFFAGPARYFVAPSLWWGRWCLDGAARRRSAVRAVLTDVAEETGLRRSAPSMVRRAGRLSLLIGLGALGAGLTSVFVHRALDIRSLYAHHLDEVEGLLLYGSVSEDPNARRYGVGLLDVMARLDALSAARREQEMKG